MDQAKPKKSQGASGSDSDPALERVGDDLEAPKSHDDDGEQFQASRTQVITTAELSVEDDDGGLLAASATGPMPEASPGRAHECLEIRTPVEEFESYVRARIDTLSKLGESERVDLMVQALELGKRKLARITGMPTH